MNVPVKRGTARRLGLARAARQVKPDGVHLWINPRLTPWPENWTPYDSSFIMTEAQAVNMAQSLLTRFLNSRVTPVPPALTHPLAAILCARCDHSAAEHHKLHCEAPDCDCPGGYITA